MQLRDKEEQLRDRLDVRETQILVKPVPDTNLLSDSTLRNAARKAFESPYQDSIGVVQSLIVAMQKCRHSWQTCWNPSEMLYAPYIAVVQASMMGKTRMFFTLPKHNIYVFYICLRADGSYPSGLDQVVKALTSESCTEGYYAAFMLAALQALNDFKRMQNDSIRGHNYYHEWLQLQQNLSFWKPILGEEVFEFLCNQNVK